MDSRMAMIYDDEDWEQPMLQRQKSAISIFEHEDGQTMPQNPPEGRARGSTITVLMMAAENTLNWTKMNFGSSHGSSTSTTSDHPTHNQPPCKNSGTDGSYRPRRSSDSGRRRQSSGPSRSASQKHASTEPAWPKSHFQRWTSLCEQLVLHPNWELGIMLVISVNCLFLVLDYYEAP
eukprot:gene16043-19027_t